MKLIIFDTETTGLPVRGASLALQPAILQFAFVMGHLSDAGDFREVGRMKWYLDPKKRIDPGAQSVHGIDAARVAGCPEFGAFSEMVAEAIGEADVVAGHNVTFDLEVLGWERQRLGLEPLRTPRVADTMLLGTDLCKIPGRMGQYKWPKLSELHRFLFGKPFDGAHDALGDVEATIRCLVEMAKRGLVPGVALSAAPAQAPEISDTF